MLSLAISMQVFSSAIEYNRAKRAFSLWDFKLALSMDSMIFKDLSGADSIVASAESSFTPTAVSLLYDETEKQIKKKIRMLFMND